jgi:hypothetical protein
VPTHQPPQPRNDNTVMHRRIILVLAAAAVAALSIGLRSFSSVALAERATLPAATTDSTVASELTLTVGEKIEFNFRVTNNTKKYVEIRFPSGKTHDFVVLDSLDREVWRWSSGRMFTQVLKNKVMRAQESIAFEESWKSPAEGGTFTAVALLSSRNYPLEERVQFVVPAR